MHDVIKKAKIYLVDGNQTTNYHFPYICIFNLFIIQSFIPQQYMSSDQQNINEVEYSDDSDYEHRDSVLSTGHRNSLAHKQSHRQSVSNRQSKRLSYGKKHNESKIQEILNKPQQSPVPIHQTESHIISSDLVNDQGQPQLQPKLQETVLSSDVDINQKAKQNESNANQSQMLVSMNDSQNQSDVFEVMEMSQSSQQQPQSRIEALQETLHQQENTTEQPQNLNDSLDYLPEQPYVETYHQQPVETTNQQMIQNEAEKNQDKQKVEQPNAEEQPQNPSQQQATQVQQTQQHEADEQFLNQEPQTLTNQVDFPQITNQIQGHSLGDEFNTNENQGEEQILNSFRDSTEEKRRNRVPGNSQIEYLDQNDYDVNEDSVNTNLYTRKPSESLSQERQQQQAEQNQQQKQQQDIKQQKKPITEEAKQLNDINEQQQNQQQSQQQAENHQKLQEPITQGQKLTREIQETQINQNQEPQTQQEVHQPPTESQQNHQQKVTLNQVSEHIITSQDVAFTQQSESQQQLTQTTTKHPNSEQKHQSQQTQQHQKQQISQIHQNQPAEQQVQERQPELQNQKYVLQQQNRSSQDKKDPESYSNQLSVETTLQQTQNTQEEQRQQVPEIKTVEIQALQIKNSEEQQEWPSSYGHSQQPLQASEPQIQQRHEQVESVISQPNHDRQQSSEDDQSNQQPSSSALDQRLPLPQSDSQQPNNISSNILPSSDISSQSEQGQGMISIVSHTTMRQSHQLTIQQSIEQRQSQESTVFQKFEGIQVDFTKNHSSYVAESEIRQSNQSQGSVWDMESEKGQSHIILQESHHGIQTVPEEEQPIESQQPNQQHCQLDEEVIESPQNQSQSDFIKIQQDNSSFAHSESNARYIQSDIPPQQVHNLEINQPPTSYEQLHAQVPPAVMTRVESSQQLPVSPVRQLDQSKKKDLETSEYFVMDKNLSSLDIYGRSEYNQYVQPPQLTSNQSMSQRESVAPHPFKSQLLKQAQKKKEESNIQINHEQLKAFQKVSARISVPHTVQVKEEEPKIQEPRDSLRNSVSNADLVISTSELQSSKKSKKDKAGSGHKAPVENPESCKCTIF